MSFSRRVARRNKPPKPKVDLESFTTFVNSFTQDETVRTLDEWYVYSEQFYREYQVRLAELRRQAGLPREGGFFYTRLHDGSRGWFERRSDDCLQASLATLLQIPPVYIPDLSFDERYFAGEDPELVELEAIQTIGNWAEKYGVTMRVQATPPSTGRWIGVVGDPEAPNNDHCLIMNGRSCIFDPSAPLPSKDGGWLGTESNPNFAYALVVER